jgi:hypothetical protein
VFHKAIKIHREGASGLAFRKVAIFSSHKYDRNSSFIQRIHFVTFLFKHFKYAANIYMQQSGIETKTALIWSALQQRPRFTAWWDTLSQTERNNFRFTLLYAGTSSVCVLSGQAQTAGALGKRPPTDVLEGQPGPSGSNKRRAEDSYAPVDPSDAPVDPQQGLWHIQGIAQGSFPSMDRGATTSARPEGANPFTISDEEVTEAFPEHLYDGSANEAGGEGDGGNM